MFADHAADNEFINDFTPLFAQDQWTAGRLTLQGGVRFEHIGSFYPEARILKDVFVPDELVFPAQDAGVGPKDINPRFGVGVRPVRQRQDRVQVQPGPISDADERVRDLRPPAAAVVPRGHDDQPVAGTICSFRPATRAGQLLTDCDLLNLGANGECGAGNPSFGQAVFATTYDPAMLNGWNIREYSWDLNAGVQHEIVPRVSAEIYYVRRSWGNQTVTDNRAYAPADYDRFALTAPSQSVVSRTAAATA